MVQRCGVWQIKHMSSQDQDQVSMKSNMFGFRGYSQMKFHKTYKTAKKGLVWFGLVRSCISCQFVTYFGSSMSFVQSMLLVSGSVKGVKYCSILNNFGVYKVRDYTVN